MSIFDDYVRYETRRHRYSAFIKKFLHRAG